MSEKNNQRRRRNRGRGVVPWYFLCFLNWSVSLCNQEKPTHTLLTVALKT